MSSILSTKSYLLTKINHQEKSQRCASTKHNITTHNHHQDQYVLLIIYQYKYATPYINHVLTIKMCLQPCTKYVPIMYQLLVNYDSSRSTNIIKYTPHVCGKSLTTCLNQNPSSISSSKYRLYLCNRPGVYHHIPANLP
jgi:hypothetical protein